MARSKKSYPEFFRLIARIKKVRTVYLCAGSDRRISATDSRPSPDRGLRSFSSAGRSSVDACQPPQADTAIQPAIALLRANRLDKSVTSGYVAAG